MADNNTAASDENQLSLNLVDQRQHVSADSSLCPQFNFTSFVTTSSACPVDLYQVSDDFYDPDSLTNIVSTDYYKFPTGIKVYDPVASDETVYSTQEGQTDIGETPSPTLCGTISSGSYFV